MAEFNTDHLTLEPDAEAVVMGMVRECGASLEDKSKREGLVEFFKERTLRTVIIEILMNQFVGGRARSGYNRTISAEDLGKEEQDTIRFTIKFHLGLVKARSWSKEKGWTE